MILIDPFLSEVAVSPPRQLLEGDGESVCREDSAARPLPARIRRGYPKD